jgi:hypothetical protein
LKTSTATCNEQILGVEGGELNATASKALGINQTEGFYVCSDKNSGAEKSGLKRRYYQKWMVKDCYLCGPVWIYQYQKTQ